MSNFVEKAKEVVDKIAHPSHKEGTHSTNAGPHDSNLGNKADPRVDSDRDGSRNAGAATGTTGYNTGSTTTGYSGTTTGGSTTAGPYSSNLANKADPRVDSDLDGSRTVGGTGAGYGTGSTTSGYGTGSTTTTGGYGGSTTAGPHSSNLANKADPRVDSDLDGSRTAGGTGAGYGTGSTTAGYGTGSTTTTGGYGGSTTAGPHSSNFANKADPRVDSDLDGSRTVGGGSGYTGTGTTGGGYTGTGTTGTTTGGYGDSSLTGNTGPGPAPNTAGPHSSDMANKLDPRVDSDLDGSKTVGGNKTYTSVDDGVPDAAIHKPSDFQKLP